MTANQVIKHFVPIMAEHGFQRKRNNFFRESEDMIFGVSFENPGLMYCQFYIIPLWIPTENIYYSYGNRLNNFAKCPPLCPESSDEQISQWVINTITLLENSIFPFFDTVSTPEKLLDFLQSTHKNISKFLCCPQNQIDRLKIYLVLFLGKFEALPIEINRTIKNTLAMDCYTEAVKANFLAELQNLNELQSSHKSEDMKLHFDKIISENRHILRL